MIRLFSREALRTGWSVWWRAWVPFMIITAIVLIAVFSLGLLQTKPSGSGNPSMLAMLFPLLVGIGLNIGLIVWLDKSSKTVALKRYQVEIKQFVGWKVFWRMWLMMLALGIPTTLLFTITAEITKVVLQASEHQALVIRVASSALDALVRIVFVVMACGWAFGRALKPYVQKTESLTVAST